MYEAIVIKNVELYIPITDLSAIDLQGLFELCANVAKKREQLKPLGGIPYLSLGFAKEILGILEGYNYKNEYLLGYIETLEKGEY